MVRDILRKKSAVTMHLQARPWPRKWENVMGQEGTKSSRAPRRCGLPTNRRLQHTRQQPSRWTPKLSACKPPHLQRRRGASPSPPTTHPPSAAPTTQPPSSPPTTHPPSAAAPCLRCCVVRVACMLGPPSFCVITRPVDVSLRPILSYGFHRSVQESS